MKEIDIVVCVNIKRKNMKTTINYLWILAAVLMIGVVSCSKDDADLDKAKTKSVLLKISQKSPPKTYAIDPLVEDETEINFDNGQLYFLDGSNNIVKHYYLADGDVEEWVGFYYMVDDLHETNFISMDDLLSGVVVIEDLDEDVVEVMLIGNSLWAHNEYGTYDFKEPLPRTGNMYDILYNNTVKIIDQGFYEYVNLIGSSALVPIEGEGNQFECNIELYPTLSRIEITDVCAGGNIRSFVLNGIFLDHTYTEAQYDGAINEESFVMNLPIPNLYNSPSEAELYGWPYSRITFDWFPIGVVAVKKQEVPTNSPLKLPPNSVNGKVDFGSDRVCAYNVFADGGHNFPRIILRLSMIDIEGEGLVEGPKFVTITGFKDKWGSPLYSMNSGEIYNMGAGKLTFTEKHLFDQPHPDIDLDVEVSVRLPQWQVEITKPDFYIP